MRNLFDSKILYFYWKSQIFYYCTVYWRVLQTLYFWGTILKELKYSRSLLHVLGTSSTPLYSSVRANLVAFFCIRHNLGEKKLKSIDKWTVQILLTHGITTKSLQTYQCRRQPTVARILRERRCQRCPCGRWVYQAEVSQGYRSNDMRDSAAVAQKLWGPRP